MADAARPSLWGATRIGLETDGLDPVPGECFVDFTRSARYSDGADRHWRRG
jgi:hypothetical protein